MLLQSVITKLFGTSSADRGGDRGACSARAISEGTARATLGTHSRRFGARRRLEAEASCCSAPHREPIGIWRGPAWSYVAGRRHQPICQKDCSGMPWSNMVSQLPDKDGAAHASIQTLQRCPEPQEEKNKTPPSSPHHRKNRQPAGVATPSMTSAMSAMDS